MFQDTIDSVVTLILVYILVLLILDPVCFKWSVVKLLSQAAGVSVDDGGGSNRSPRRSLSSTSRRSVRVSRGGSNTSVAKSGPGNTTSAKPGILKKSSSKSSTMSRKWRSGALPKNCPRPASRMYREIRVMEPILEEWGLWRRGDKI